MNEDILGIDWSSATIASSESIGSLNNRINERTGQAERRISVDSSPFGRVETGFISDSSSFPIWTETINTSRPTLTTNNTRNNLNEGNLIFVDMKIENAGEEEYKVVMTYIDKENFKEVRREFNCNINFNKTSTYSLVGSDRISLNYQISNTSEIRETSKDI